MRYSKKQVGNTAGVIWQYLKNNDQVTISELNRKTDLKRTDILLAIGWLLKEDKITPIEDGRATRFSLT